MIPKLIRWIDNFAAAGGYVSALFMVLIVILITVEIFLRTVFNFSTLIADEYSAYFFVAVVMLGLALTLRDEAHIRITLIRPRLSPNGLRIIDILVVLIAVALCSFALYHSAIMVYDTYTLEMTADSISETPIYLPQIVIPIGFLMFELQLIAIFLRRLISSPTRSS